MSTTSLKDKSLKTLTRALSAISLLFKNTINLFSKRDFIVIAFFTILGIGGVFAAGLVTLTPAESQGAGYAAATACDEQVTINKDVVFDSTLKRYVISTISITDVDQRHQLGCGNQILELALPYNGSTTYASWTIPSSTITNGVFTYGANSSTGITYRAYTPITPIDVEYSFASAAINTRPSTRAVTNGPVYDLLKDNGFTTTGQDGASLTITFALSLSCGTLTVDTTQPGVSAALAALDQPFGYVKNNATSTGANGATTAALLGYRGTVANINIILPWISYNKTSATACTSLPVFQGAIWDAQSTSTPIAWNFGENGHYYQYISPSITWDAAYLAITGQSANWTASDAGDQTALPSTTRTYTQCPKKVFGLCGYFATIQTSTENKFVTSKVGTAAAWLGGNARPIPAGATSSSGIATYIWADPVAPEYNCVFFRGRNSSTAQIYYPANRGNCAIYNGTTGYSYHNFLGNQPDTWTYNRAAINETALQIVSGGAGNWNDLFEDGYAGNSMGYIIEYGGSLATGESPSGGGSSTSQITWHY